MLLSRIALDVDKRSTLIALQNPSHFHGAIERAFEPRTSRALWRVDMLHGQRYMLLLSEETPDLTSFVEQFGTGDAPEMRNYAPLLERVEAGTRWQFRLCANPTYSQFNEKGGRGKICAHKTVEHQCGWLLEQSEKHGFTVNADEFNVVNIKWYSFKKSKLDRDVRLLSVTYEGLLTVTDAQKFRDALTGGIGRGKAYGMGLLTIVRA